MKTTTEIIHSLFYEAFYFVQMTPVSEFEKYNEYSKNFAKSFNRLIKEIKDPDQRDEIITWCITGDELLTIEIIATQLNDYEAERLSRKYGVLKNLFLNEISIETKPFQNYGTLKELFIYPETYDKCINVLKTVDPPILNVENKYIGKEKSAFVLWIDVLKRYDLIDKTENDKVYSELISNEFHPFSISEGLFRKVSKRANEKYDNDFNYLLSQVYQSVKT